MIIYSLDILLFLFGTSLVFHVQFELLLPDLRIGFLRGFWFLIRFWYSHLLKNFPQFIVIHTVKGYGIVNKAEIDVFLELSCSFTVYMPTPCWLKHLCSIRALVPVSFSLTHFFRLIPWSAEALWVHFPTRASKTLSRRRSAPSPHWEGAWGPREQSKPRVGALLAFCVNPGRSASFSLLYFLISRLQTTTF